MSKKSKKVDATDASCRHDGHKRGASPRKPTKPETVDQRFEREWSERQARRNEPWLDGWEEAERKLEAALDEAMDQDLGPPAEDFILPNSLVRMLNRLDELFPDASFGNAAADLRRLGLHGPDFNAKLNAIEGTNDKRDRQWAAEVWGLSKGMKYTVAEAIRIVARDIDAHSALAARQQVKRAWIAHGKGIANYEGARAAAISALINHMLERRR